VMDFIKDIHESRMTKGDSNTAQLTYTDCCERLFLILLSIETMRQYKSYQGRVERYVKHTLSPNSFNYYRISGTDLYNFIFFVEGSDDALARLKDPESAKKARQNVMVPTRELRQYLDAVKNGQPTTRTFSLLQKIERNLKITNNDYQAIRRWASNLPKLSPNDRKLLVTRLLFASRAKLRSSDLIDDIEKWAAEKDLEVSVSHDPEPVISKPDPVTAGDLAMYRYLAGSGKLSILKRFIENARDGRAASPEMLEAYLPIIEMIDDIASGGPAYIQQLKELHRRSRRSPRK